MAERDLHFHGPALVVVIGIVERAPHLHGGDGPGIPRQVHSLAPGRKEGDEEYVVRRDLYLVVGRTVAVRVEEDLHHFFCVEGFVSLAEGAPDIVVLAVEGDIEETVVVEELRSRRAGDWASVKAPHQR